MSVPKHCTKGLLGTASGGEPTWVAAIQGEGSSHTWTNGAISAGMEWWGHLGAEQYWVGVVLLHTSEKLAIKPTKRTLMTTSQHTLSSINTSLSPLMLYSTIGVLSFINGVSSLLSAIASLVTLRIRMTFS